MERDQAEPRGHTCLCSVGSTVVSPLSVGLGIFFLDPVTSPESRPECFSGQMTEKVDFRALGRLLSSDLLTI